ERKVTESVREWIIKLNNFLEKGLLLEVQFYKKTEDSSINNRTIIELKEPNYFSRQVNIDKTRKKIEEEYIDKKEEAERVNA
ncbi:33078_t:CDS:2, partial [Racocetra persica]